MKSRAFAFALAAASAVGIVAASQVALARAAPRAYALDRPEVEVARRVANRLSSDVRNGRGAKPRDVARLFAIAERGGPASWDAYAGLVVLEHSPHRATVLRLASRSARSWDEQEAYGGIELLRWWGDPRWRALALRREDDPDDFCRPVVDMANE